MHDDMKNTNAKTVVITGGTKGIGAAIARYCHERGMQVIIGARSKSGLALGLKERAWFVPCDVRRLGDHQRLVKAAIKHTGRLDVYVNCAGFSAWKPLKAIDKKFLESMIDVNLKGAFYGCQAAAGQLSRGGVIINISSLAGRRGSANNSAYCMAKFGVTGLTQALAKELGPQGIRVNAVCPVYVNTEGVLEALKDKHSPAAGGDVKKYLAQFALTQSALGRLPQGHEVAAAVYFLASEEASAITGQSLNVDCGVLPQ